MEFKKIRESSFLRADRLKISARELLYGICHLKTNKLYGTHVFELIRCYRSEFW